MKTLIFKITVCLFFAASLKAYSQTPSNLVGTWHNDLQSTLKIANVNSATGQISGTYTIIANGQPQTFALTGYVNDKAASGNHVVPVTFIVRYNAYGSVCAWSGFLAGSGAAMKITTMWHLVSANSSTIYNHINTGSDIFKK